MKEHRAPVKEWGGYGRVAREVASEHSEGSREPCKQSEQREKPVQKEGPSQRVPAVFQTLREDGGWGEVGVG